MIVSAQPFHFIDEETEAQRGWAELIGVYELVCDHLAVRHIQTEVREVLSGGTAMVVTV